MLIVLRQQEEAPLQAIPFVILDSRSSGGRVDDAEAETDSTEVTDATWIWTWTLASSMKQNIAIFARALATSLKLDAHTLMHSLVVMDAQHTT